MKICYIPLETSLEIKNVNYVSVQRPKGYQATLYEARKQHAFIYTASGTMHYNFSDPHTDDLIASTGELVFIPTATKYNSTYMDNENMVTIVQFDLAAGALPDHLKTPSLIKMDAAEKIFSSINNDLQAGAGDNGIYFLYRIYELFWHISQNAQKLPAKYRKLQPALKEIHQYYSDNHKILYYADLCGMSEPGFRRLFKEYTNVSPVEYRNKMRLQEAKKLLNSGEFSIEEAALTVGFSNLSFFCRSYKQQFGHSPGKDT